MGRYRYNVLVRAAELLALHGLHVAGDPGEDGLSIREAIVFAADEEESADEALVFFAEFLGQLDPPFASIREWVQSLQHDHRLVVVTTTLRMAATSPQAFDKDSDEPR